MRQFFARIASSFSDIKSQIAFYPTILTFAGLVLALFMKVVETTGISQSMVELMPQVAIKSGDTARTIMSVCIGGLISMMVFSFSMVMMILNQASNNYSPRLLPGLISDKVHQIILGLYMGTIMYSIFTLFSIEPSDQEYSLPGLSILIGIGLTIFCLALFIYFIHNVSQSIQINNILDRIFDTAYDRLMDLIEQEREANIPENFPNTKNWYHYSVKAPGYFQNILVNNTMELAAKKGTLLYISRPKGFFVPEKMPFIWSREELDEHTVNDFLSNINFARGEIIETNYILAFKQITEVAVKAMSPGINDPGTAINAIDYLTELFALRLKKMDRNLYGQSGTTYLKVASISFSELMYFTMASLRTYCCGDPLVVQRLIVMLKYLNRQEMVDSRYREVVKNELKALVDQANVTLQSETDLKKINAIAFPELNIDPDFPT
ncbi:DUF2254 domain-containing protein [Membranicola marinus]|uniref:DUF2254 domain-containing protein n=1 Tax=Membranihabitans marinus TaxID=1227546 RepID=A0A953I2U6_9BACT|nr:DUF2254 domain-containing protein [Membranihabitans marinus]MBY5960197.1 DUF2254 domain-containing protein [Membranihabitans marinus]